MINKTISLENVISKPEGLDPIMYHYYKCLQNRIVLINDEISDSIIEMAVIPLLEMDNDGSGKPITIYLNTRGGDIYNGFSLVDTIEKLKTPTEIRILAMAASMGALIAMAGHNNPNVKTVCSDFSIGLIHGGSQYLEGNASSVKDTFKFAERYESKIKNYILSHSEISLDEYERMERYEWYMTSDEMLEKGIVDGII